VEKTESRGNIASEVRGVRARAFSLAACPRRALFRQRGSRVERMRFPSDNPVVLEVEGIVKSFPGVRALDGVHFELRAGEVHALVGENGAGKSTLIHILGGIFKPDEGQIRMRGQPVAFANPRHAADQGIGIVFQELSLAPNLTVAENIFFNRQPVRAFGLVDRAELDRRAGELLQTFRMPLKPRERAGKLPVALQQMVEILKALARDPEVLILDEPTTSLGSAEAERLFGIIAEWRTKGRSVIYVSHHLPEIFRICDRVTVLRDGRNVETRGVREVDEAKLASLMVGRELKNIYGERTSQIGQEEMLRVEGACSGQRVRQVSLSARAGEIVGLAGLVGSGRTELGRAIFGAPPFEDGRVFIAGREVRIRNPAEAIRQRVAYMTEDRKEQGLFLKMSLRENCVAPSLDCFVGPGGFLREREITRRARVSQALFGITAPSVQQVRNLSGGNQQKVLLAMWIGVQPLVLVVDEPTRGVDVGAKGEIYHLLRESAARGIAILLISSDLTEVLGMSDRILVMREGRIEGELSRTEATEERIIAYAAGVTGDRG
jgi:ABC-type sugar transport system ATPase subunit